MSDLKQAQIAVQQQDWVQFSQCLQHLRGSASPSATAASAVETGEPALAAWVDLSIQALIAGDFQIRWDIAKVFPRFGTAAIAPLIELLQDEELDLDVRWFAARILAEFDHPDSIRALVDLLQTNEDEDLKAMAAEALAQMGSSSISVLASLLTQPQTQLLAVQALARIRRSEVIEPLLGVVQSPDATVRAAAVEALSSFHDDRITAVLLGHLSDPATAVRREAIMGLSRRRDLLETVDLVEQLRPCLWDINLEVCRQAAIALGRLGTDAAVDLLAHLLRSPNTPALLQVDVVRSLGWTQHSAALEVLAQGLQTENEAVGREIVFALGQMDFLELKRQAIPYLMQVIRQEVPAARWPSIRQAAALELGRLGNAQAFAPLVELLADSDSSIRLHAIAALKQLDAPAVLSHLQQLAQQPDLPPALSEGVAIALQEW